MYIESIYKRKEASQKVRKALRQSTLLNRLKAYLTNEVTQYLLIHSKVSQTYLNHP